MGLYCLKQAAASENNARTELKIATIGQPTLVGSCGSDVYVQDTVGILICGSNIEGCWELVKFMLENYGSTDDSLPVYMPLLRKEIDDAKNSTDLQVTFNDRDFLKLLEKVNNTAVYDNTVQELLKTNLNDFLDGKKSAEETADAIQTKISLFFLRLYCMNCCACINFARRGKLRLWTEYFLPPALLIYLLQNTVGPHAKPAQ